MIRKPTHHQLLFLLSAILAVLLSAQTYLMGPKAFWGGTYTHYNNFVIFKYSFQHLLSAANLYELHLSQHADFFKYSPSFALFMAPFWYLPNVLGLCLWNWINIFILLAGLSAVLEHRKYFWWAVLLTLPELIVATQNSQSNALIVGLLLLAFSALKKEKSLTAAVFIAIAVFIKPFALAFFLLVPFLNKPKKFLLFSSIVGLLLLLLPALIIGLDGLLQSYKSWLVLLQKDEQKSLGFSAYAIAKNIGIGSKLPVFIVGLVLLFAPLLNYKNEKNGAFLLAQMLLWMVVFNFKAESPSYIIAMAGCAVWLFCNTPTKTKIIVASLSFIAVSVVKMDFVPVIIRNTNALQVLCPLLPLVIMVSIFIASLPINKAGNTLQSSQRHSS